MKCLLVDDEPGIREGLAALLRRRGHEVRTAGDCDSAREALQHRDYDLVVTDWRLPDGTALQFLGECPCPVVAISGHPEEIAPHPAVHVVMTKPVSPQRLLEVLAEAGANRSAEPVEPEGELSDIALDVQRVVECALDQLEGAASVEIVDDGTFVIVRAELDDERPVPYLATLGGDLRVLGSRRRPIAELRLFRDGRPDRETPVVRPADAWPDNPTIAVDFDGIGLEPREFATCLERAAAFEVRGGTVQFLNLPDALRALASDWGRSHELPMREKIGPRLPEVLTDLWS